MQFHIYSDPNRDKRMHTIATVYIARPIAGTLKADDDAKHIGIFTESNLPTLLAFDHAKIIADYFRYKETGKFPL